MADMRTELRRQDTFWRRWGAVIILIALFVFSWGGQYVSQMQVAKQEAEQHGQEFQMSEFVPQFAQSTFENWQSEWLQLVTQALLIGAFADYLFRKEHEDQYEMMVMLDDIQKQLGKKKR
jgi:hypothetical protein